jgi:endonuclease III
MNDEDVAEFLGICSRRNASAAPDPITASPVYTYPHMFLLSCLMQRQISPLEGWAIPRKVAEDMAALGLLEDADHPDLDIMAAAGQGYYEDVFERRGLHPHSRAMSHVFCSALVRIRDVYGSDASRIWSDRPSSACLIGRFLDFNGFGASLASMAACMLARDYRIPLSDHYSIDVMTDIHIKRTFCRLGLVEIPEGGPGDVDPVKVVYKARELCPEYPGMLDLQCWEIGIRKVCRNDRCMAHGIEDCPFSDICPRIGLPPSATFQTRLF